MNCDKGVRVGGKGSLPRQGGVKDVPRGDCQEWPLRAPACEAGMTKGQGAQGVVTSEWSNATET